MFGLFKFLIYDESEGSMDNNYLEFLRFDNYFGEGSWIIWSIINLIGLEKNTYGFYTKINILIIVAS